jgi:hypothetical protein
MSLCDELRPSSLRMTALIAFLSLDLTELPVEIRRIKVVAPDTDRAVALEEQDAARRRVQLRQALACAAVVRDAIVHSIGNRRECAGLRGGIIGTFECARALHIGIKLARPALRHPEIWTVELLIVILDVLQEGEAELFFVADT